jgi:hypothetical protein
MSSLVLHVVHNAPGGGEQKTVEQWQKQNASQSVFFAPLAKLVNLARKRNGW